MALTIDVVKGDVHVTLVLNGDVDTKTAPELLGHLTSLELHALEQLRLDLIEVDFVSSAGLRAIVFAKQKMPHSSRLYLIGPSSEIVETITKTGLAQAVVIVESEAEI
jgi:anti-anti-sigma factor